MTVKICAVADSHVCLQNLNPAQIEPVDILTVSGDLTLRGNLKELSLFRQWVSKQPAKYKVVIAGNHDFCLEDTNSRAEAETVLGGDGIIYLRDSLAEIMGLKIWGTPWQPWFHNWAFNLNRGEDIRRKWDLIPEGLDLLLTHGPPFGFGDRTLRGERVGCEDLLSAIKQVEPKVTCFGHIHEDVGEWQIEDLKLINCSIGYEVGWHDRGVRGPFYFEL